MIEVLMGVRAAKSYWVFAVSRCFLGHATWHAFRALVEVDAI